MISWLTSQKLAITVADVSLYLVANSVVFRSFSLCYTAQVHVHQIMIMSNHDPSSIRLKENRARTGHFATHQQSDSMRPSPAHVQIILYRAWTHTVQGTMLTWRRRQTSQQCRNVHVICDQSNTYCSVVVIRE